MNSNSKNLVTAQKKLQYLGTEWIWLEIALYTDLLQKVKTVWSYSFSESSSFQCKKTNYDVPPNVYKLCRISAQKSTSFTGTTSNMIGFKQKLWPFGMKPIWKRKSPEKRWHSHILHAVAPLKNGSKKCRRPMRWYDMHWAQWSAKFDSERSTSWIVWRCRYTWVCPFLQTVCCIWGNAFIFTQVENWRAMVTGAHWTRHYRDGLSRFECLISKWRCKLGFHKCSTGSFWAPHSREASWKICKRVYTTFWQVYPLFSDWWNEQVLFIMQCPHLVKKFYICIFKCSHSYWRKAHSAVTRSYLDVFPWSRTCD